MKLKEIKEFKGFIVLKTGLHIGAGNAEMQIGGTDNPVVKHPHTLQPYIPGSSLKGKIRSLIELRSELMKYTGGDVVSEKTLKEIEKERTLNHDEKQKLIKRCQKIIKLFGSGAGAGSGETVFGPTRVAFADCFINEDWLKDAQEKRYSLVEIKSENVIDRIHGTARDPRFIERVPAGVKFDFKVTLKVFDEDLTQNGKNELEELLLIGIKLLEMDALGGSTSRGYGRIKFEGEIENELQKITNFDF